MDVLTFETCRAVNSEIIKQVISSWSIFIQLRKNIYTAGDEGPPSYKIAAVA
jgi:hypothetical protein